MLGMPVSSVSPGDGGFEPFRDRLGDIDGSREPLRPTLSFDGILEEFFGELCRESGKDSFDGILSNFVELCPKEVCRESAICPTEVCRESGKDSFDGIRESGKDALNPGSTIAGSSWLGVRRIGGSSTLTTGLGRGG
jgi:hypothetical protein